MFFVLKKKLLGKFIIIIIIMDIKILLYQLSFESRSELVTN